MDKNRAIKAMIEAQHDVKRAEKLLKVAVTELYEAGASWAEIGGLLGLSKQTAYNRYGKDKDRSVGEIVMESNAASKAAHEKDAEDTRKVLAERAGKASKKVNAAAPAKGGYNGPFMALDRRYGRIIEEPYEGMARPGTGKGKHRCEGCGHNNHHGAERGHVYWNDGCKPTKYDTAEEAEFLNLVYKEKTK